MEITTNTYAEILKEFKPQIGNYDWLWALLKVKSRVSGHFPGRVYAFLKRFINPKKPYFIGVNCDGVRFLGDARDSYSANCAVYPDYDEVVMGLLRREVCGRRGAVLDIGANMGVISAGISPFLGEGQTAYAFEPVPETARRAAATLALNGVQNVRLFQAAVGDQDGELTFYAAPGFSEGASALRMVGVPFTYQETKVPCWTVDGLHDMKGLAEVALIKVDVEGFEPQVIAGARETISRNHPAIVYEYNPSAASCLNWTAWDVALQINASGRYGFQVLDTNGSTCPLDAGMKIDSLVNILAHAAPAERPE